MALEGTRSKEGVLNAYQLVKDIAAEVTAVLIEGGPGSGNFGHKGRPGHRGGSLPGGGNRWDFCTRD